MDLSIIQSEPMQSPVSSDRKMSGVRPLTPGLKGTYCYSISMITQQYMFLSAYDLFALYYCQGMGSIPNMLLNRKNTAKLVSTNIVQTSRLGRHDSNEGDIFILGR